MARDVLVLTESDLRGLVGLDLQAVDVVERAFVALAAGDVVMPPILSMEIPSANGEVDVKAAYIPGFDSFAIKVSPGFFDNPKLGLPSLNGLMVLFSAHTGLVEALLLDNGYLTDVRTAAAGAVAARHLAPDIKTAGVMGAGVQARLQIKAAHLIRPFERVLVWARDAAKAHACAADLAGELGVEASVEADPARLMAECQLVATTTPARRPIVRADWLHAGLHITAMGSDQGGKNEIDPLALAQASPYVADRVSQCAALGELRSAIEAGVLHADGVIELGAIAAGRCVGRSSPEAVTICDLTGTGVQDTAIAAFAFALARERNVGARIQT